MDSKLRFLKQISSDLFNKVGHNKKTVEKLAASFGVTDKTEVKELTELAIVLRARTIAQSSHSIEEKYWKIVELYESQVNISHRTSQSMLLQQYSTPAPISYLAGIFVNANESISIFEPSAGNGLLTVAAHPSNVIVNEIDTLRRSNLERQGYKQVLKQDATKPFSEFYKKFDGIITNPPFGLLDKEVKYETFTIELLDHLMALRAIDCMKDNGKAAIIIGGHTRYDRKGRIQKGKHRYFFNYLYSRYNVVDLINIDGHKLYSRQGTSFDVRLILIDGRKQSVSGAAPLRDDQRDKVVDSFEDLFDRVMSVTQPRKIFSLSKHELERQAIALEKMLNNYGLIGVEDDDDLTEHERLFKRFMELKEVYPNELLLFETTGTLVAFQDQAINLAKTLRIGHIEATTPNFKYVIAGISKIMMPFYIPVLDNAGIKHLIIPNGQGTDWKALEEEALRLWRSLHGQDELGMPYTPASKSCVVLNTVVPDSMGYETHAALERIKEAVGGDIDEYVRIKLNYKSHVDLCKALSAEQIDAVAMSIYNIEERGVGMIIGDQTGIGKGRIAASIIRYAVGQGLKPIFLTEKANLFSDIYRDLSAIGSGHLVPFIVNARESKTDIKDEEGNVIYQAPAPEEQNRIFTEQRVPVNYRFVLGTYSQFNSPDKKPTKPAFLNAIAEDNIVIMDEAHNSSGAGNTGNFLQSALSQTRGVVFLSATFAKRPDNMPIYAMKTSIRDASMSRESLIEAIVKGGVALQEILASQLVAEGQMIRRERSFEGVEVNYVTLDEKEQEHKAVSDNVTSIVRDIIQFQTRYVDEMVEELDSIAVAEGKQVEVREGTSQAGVDNLPYFSKVFNVINQMLFSIKAEAVAERAIARLKEGKKPVIAFSSTMGSFIEQMENDSGLPVSDGDVINADFSLVLQRGLDGILRYTETDVDGQKVFRTFDITEFSPEAQAEYFRISERIKQASTGISISPIDVIIEKIQAAGYSVAEVTGRKYKLQFNGPKNKAELGVAGGQADYRKGDKVIQHSTGKKGTVSYGIKQGNFIPGQDNTKNYTFHYDVQFEDGSSDSVEEHDLRSASHSPNQYKKALVLSRKRENTNDAFRRFNNNEVDVLLINQSGSTGASAHAIVTPKVPKEQVRRRVMIVLQAELDINTEVQKRGRINRTGQIFKPIYDYVNSAIPAEKRLMMMLQKKLKSLDANTTSNQKSSTKILDVPDFLNKYGDRIVAEYLKENPEVNMLLDDPLGIATREIDGAELEDASHKVSGRVAVLSTQMQQDFYNEISIRYNEFVEYLKQVGDYDLEVEAMDLKAETISAKPVIVGKGGTSAFGDDSVLETVMANVLKKPFSKQELSNLLSEVLLGKDARELQQDMLADYERFTTDLLAKEIEVNAASYDELINEIPNEKKLQKILDKEGETAFQDAVGKRRKELLLAKAVAEEKINRSHSNRKQYLEAVLNAFYIGRNLNYPFTGFEDSSQDLVPAVFLGFILDKKKKNPYAPSSIRLRFALANSNKYIAIPASYAKDIRAIIGASVTAPHLEKEELLEKWEASIKASTVDRKVRHIITGNVLQAFSSYQGKLVSYTTADGGVKKGILMPEYWEPGGDAQQKTVVPIARAIKIIRSLTIGSSVTTKNLISIFRQPGKFKIMVSSARSKGGDVYLDPDILKIVDNNNFEKVSDKMTASLDESKIDEFVNTLQAKFNDSLAVTPTQYELIRQEISKPAKVDKPMKVVQLKQATKSLTEQLELEALALELELKLLNFAA